MSTDLREVLDLAEAVRILSDGAFDIPGAPTRWGPRPDRSGQGLGGGAGGGGS